jgi:hypothetical protein
MIVLIPVSALALGNLAVAGWKSRGRFARRSRTQLLLAAAVATVALIVLWSVGEWPGLVALWPALCVVYGAGLLGTVGRWRFLPARSGGVGDAVRAALCCLLFVVGSALLVAIGISLLR